MDGSVRMKNTKLSRPEQGRGQLDKFVGDPFYFTVYDVLTGDIIAEDILFEMALEFRDRHSDRASEFTWENDVFTIDALNAEVHFALNDTYTIEQGILDLVITDGVVTTAVDSGMFDGLLPSVGSTGVLTFDLPNVIEFDYDLGNFSDQDVWGKLNGDVIGEAYGVLVPVPSAASTSLAFIIGMGLARYIHERRVGVTGRRAGRDVGIESGW